MAIIKSNRDLDTTIITVVAGILGLVVTVGLMVLHARNPTDEGSILSPEIIMALIQLPGLFASYALGKKAGQTEMSNGNNQEGENK